MRPRLYWEIDMKDAPKPKAYVSDVTLVNGKWEIGAERTIDQDEINDAQLDLNPKDIPRDILAAMHDFIVRGLE